MDSLAKLSGAVAETVNRRRFLKTMAGSALAGVLTIVAPELVVASETTRMITSKTRQHQHHPPHDPCKYYCYAQTGCPSCSGGYLYNCYNACTNSWDYSVCLSGSCFSQCICSTCC